MLVHEKLHSLEGGNINFAGLYIKLGFIQGKVLAPPPEIMNIFVTNPDGEGNWVLRVGDRLYWLHRQLRSLSLARIEPYAVEVEPHGEDFGVKLDGEGNPMQTPLAEFKKVQEMFPYIAPVSLTHPSEIIARYLEDLFERGSNDDDPERVRMIKHELEQLLSAEG